MYNKLLVLLKNFDWLLFFTVMLLVSFGLAESYSIGLGQEKVNLLNFEKQLMFVGIGLIFLFLLSSIDYFSLRSFGNYLYIFSSFILLIVLFAGKTIRGTKGWFQFAGFNLQPVEFVKIVLIIMLAKYFSQASLKLGPFKHLFVSGLITSVFAGLVIAQPDFGSAMLLLMIWVIIMFSAGLKKRYFLVIGAIIALIFTTGWLFFFKDYQKQRIMTFINPSADALDKGYNVTQAIIAVGSGGVRGRGIGFGSQSQLKFLPEAHTDFIFAVISEELGFLGVLLVAIFFGFFFYRCIFSLKRIKDDFGIFIVLGSVGLIFIEMFINISMNIGLLPVIGISLPFLSYGGSSIISTLMLVGIIESVIIRSKINY